MNKEETFIQSVRGIVTNYDGNKGFGFIRVFDDITEERWVNVFIHVSEVENSNYLQKNEELVADVFLEEKGWRATNAEVLY